MLETVSEPPKGERGPGRNVSLGLRESVSAFDAVGGYARGIFVLARERRWRLHIKPPIRHKIIIPATGPITAPMGKALWEAGGL